MGKLAFLFPGQGSQYIGMGSDLYQRYSLVRDLFHKANERLGLPLSTICFDGPEDQLTMTANTQPAILVTSLAVWSVLTSEGIEPDLVAGHSLGEYSALVAAGSLDFSDAVFAVRNRGVFMQDAVPLGQGAMAAILGLELDQVSEVCLEAAEGEILEVANINCPGQVVIAGHNTAVERAVKIASGRGARRAVKLQVSAPFHSSLMLPAQEKMRKVLSSMQFRQLKCPLINNADVALLETGNEARDGLIKQIIAPVRWEESVRKAIKLGVDKVVEVGPGKVLLGMVKRIDRGIECFNAEDEDSLRKTVEALRE